MTIRYQREDGLSAADYIAVLESSGLAERRPVDEPERMAATLKASDLIVTARDDKGRIVGVSRNITDFAISCYCADLAVDRALQGQGVGTRLLAETKAILGDGVTLVLLAAPEAEGFYEHAGPRVGLLRNDKAFVIKRLR